jgi:hypothetical protein
MYCVKEGTSHGPPVGYLSMSFGKWQPDTVSNCVIGDDRGKAVERLLF